MQGMFHKYLVENETVETMLEKYEKVLIGLDYKIIAKNNISGKIHHKAIWGGRFFTYIFPSSYSEKGNRYGAEAEIYQNGDNLHFNLLVTPYMAIFNKKDVFLFTQDIVEHILDEERSVERFAEIKSKLQKYHKVKLISNMPGAPPDGHFAGVKDASPEEPVD